MKTEYYKVLAKCGHVGRHRYITKWFYVKASSGKEAAYIVRYKPRVKHDHKDAIREVVSINYYESKHVQASVQQIHIQGGEINVR